MAKTQTKTKRGTYHKNGYVKINNQEIYGLKCRPDGRYYSAEVPTKTFGKDPRVALMRFEQWKADRKGATVTLVEPRSHIKHQMIGGGVVAEVDRLHTISDAEFWRVAREKILADPFTAAKKTGLPLDRLESLPKPEQKSKLLLTEIGDLYAKKSMTTNERSRSITYWREFVDAVAPARTTDEVDEPAIERYRKFLESSKLADKSIRNRLLKIGTILNYARPRNKPHAADIDSIKSDMTLLIDRPKNPSGSPKPIKPRHFLAVLGVASTKWKAMLLLSLNAALHPKELSEVLTAEIDLEDGEFQTKRTKTGVRRCCKLWDRTIKAIRAYQSENPHDSEYMFLNSRGGQFNVNSVIDNWNRLRKASKIAEKITFDSIRDGARTNMSGDGARIVMGHPLPGIEDAYNLRMPSAPEVVEACEKLEAAYFG